MDSEYREASWRGVIITLVATIVVIAGLVLLTSRMLEENCVPGGAQADCSVPSAPAPGA